MATNKLPQKALGLFTIVHAHKPGDVFTLPEHGTIGRSQAGEALRWKLIINMPLFIPQGEGTIIKHVAYGHPHPCPSLVLFLTLLQGLAPQSYAERRSDSPSLF